MKISAPKWLNDFREKRKTNRLDNAIALLAVTNPNSIKSAPRNERRQVQRAITTLNQFRPHFVRNWYESGNPYSDGSRSYLPEYLTDARYDQNALTRREMMRRMRYWEQNSTFVKSALDVSEQYIIGTHMPVVTSMASDEKWQANAEAVFHEMCNDAGLNGESLFSMLCVGHRRKKVDGNVLFVETTKPGKVTIRSGTKHETEITVPKPCYQMVEGHRISTPYANWNDEGQNIFDGVQFKEIETKSPDGRSRKQMVKSGYWVNNNSSVTDSDGENFTPIPIEHCYYASTPHRVNEPRGISDFYAVEPTLALLEDLLKLEMRAQEVQSDISLFVTNAAGQVVNQQFQSRLEALKVKVAADANGKPIVSVKDIEQVQAYYDKKFGGRTIVGRSGDTAEMQAPNRPAEATLNLWNFLINAFCSGTKNPRLLVFPTFSKGQGTEVRAELEKASAGYIKEFNMDWKPFIHDAWCYFIGWAIKNDSRVQNPPSDWKHIEVSPPKSLTVDAGYDSANKLAQMAAGVFPLHAWAQDQGTTKSKLIKHSVRDVFDIKRQCVEEALKPENAKYGLTVEAAEVRQNLSEVVKNLAAQAAAEAQKAAAETTQEQTA